MNNSTALKKAPRETFPWLAKLEEALEGEPTHSIEDVFDGIERGRFQMWTLGGSIVVTTLTEFPQMRICEILWLAGDLDEVWEIHDWQIVPWAKAAGCGGIAGECRHGLRKSAERNGYKAHSVRMWKEI